MRIKRVTTAGLLLFVGLIAVLLGALRFASDQSKDVERDAWVGWSRGAVTAKLGRPTSFTVTTLEGRYPSDTIMLYYRTRRGHLYLWFTPGAAGGVCFHSLWSRNGMSR